MKPVAVVAVVLALAGCRPASRRVGAPAPVESAVEQVTPRKPDAVCDALLAWTGKTERNPCTDVTYLPVPGHPDLYCANCEWEKAWWGCFKVCQLQDGVVAWEAKQPTEDENAYILSARPVHIRGFSNPVFEVFDSSHMGNGHLRLYELQGQTLVLLLSTRATTNGPRIRIIESHLDPRYYDADLDGVDDLELAGTIHFDGEDIFDPDSDGDVIGHTPSYEEDCRKFYFWNAEAHRYVEDRSLRRGTDAAIDDP